MHHGIDVVGLDRRHQLRRVLDVTLHDRDRVPRRLPVPLAEIVVDDDRIAPGAERLRGMAAYVAGATSYEDGTHGLPMEM